ncbi:MAG: F0F1 ATP synthase subunit delta [Gammaproteobacteria bacterium]|nr:F0F1 ATP synthase subunit delta [Gammaproteobacteria bacterium]
MSELSSIARPYARAVFELARDDKKLPEWSEALEFLALVGADQGLQVTLNSPRLTHADRADLVLSIVAGKVSDETNNLIRLMAENDRLDVFSDIAELYEEYRREYESILQVTVTSALELQSDYENKIAAALKTKLGRDIEIKSEVDESLIAGAVIQAGDLVIDGSVKGQLAKLSTALNT